MLGLAASPACQPVAIPDAVVSTLTGIYDVLNCFRHACRRRSRQSPISRPSASRSSAPPRAEWRSPSGVPVEASHGFAEVTQPTSSSSRRSCSEPAAGRPGAIPSSSNGPRACTTKARCCARPARGLPARRDWSVRWPGDDRPLGLCRGFRARVPERAAAARSRPRGCRRARAARHLGRLNDLARSRALSHREACRRDGGADRGPVLCPAVAP